MKVLRNQLVLPLNFEILIDENDPVWKLTEICDTLDYTRLYDEYLRHWRVIDPVVLFEILVFAYMNGIYSSRAIEHACKTDIRFMWLLQGQSAPDHATFARFQNERLTTFAICFLTDFVAFVLIPKPVYQRVWKKLRLDSRHRSATVYPARL